MLAEFTRAYAKFLEKVEAEDDKMAECSKDAKPINSERSFFRFLFMISPFPGKL
jgi:hypothetical protein